MPKVIALEKCSTTINRVTYIYSRTERKIYFKRHSERDRNDYLNIFFEGLTDANVMGITNEAELINFINAQAPLPN